MHTSWRTLLVVLSVALAQAAGMRPQPALAQADISVGDVFVTVYPVGTAVVEMPVGNPSTVQQTFQFRMLLLGADGVPIKVHVTEVLRLRPGLEEWVRFTIPRADGTQTVLFDVGLFGKPSDEPCDLRNLPPNVTDGCP